MKRTNNPTDVSRKFNLMKSDMDYMLGMVEKVVSEKTWIAGA